MSLSFGGLGIMSIRRTYSDWSDIVQGSGEVKSLFFALIVFVVVGVLAYLTNPTENSFRTFLTEQSFRQHLSRLDYTNDEEDRTITEDARDAYSLISRRGCAAPSACDSPTSTPFHFANRASVSLRTPKHVFHSFGVCTIAAVVPFPKGSAGAARHGSDQDGSMILDSWFIGAFGKWWRGGAIEAWYHDLVLRSKDEEGWSSGILGFKSLDKFSDYNGFPFTKQNGPLRLPLRGSPPKLRNREQPQRNGNLPPRSSSPPPLPKSVSLPLHTTRPVSLATPDHSNTPAEKQPSLAIPVMATPVSRSSSALIEQSPIINELLRQISQSKVTVDELRAQLTEFEASALESHTGLQTEVDSFRERKRDEDNSRAELKSRTKSLEDSKRHAEGHKRDAEKRLKAAQNARDECNRRMAHFDKEITNLQERSVQDQAATAQSKLDSAQAEQEIAEVLEVKKAEIKVAEDVIVALSVRAKDLEEILACERERLSRVRERAEIRKQDHSFYPLHISNIDSNTWSPVTYGSNETSDAPVSPVVRPARLSLGAVSNFSPKSSEHSLRSQNYPMYDDDLTVQPQRVTTFSPFGDAEPISPMSTKVSPTSKLIPAGLVDTSTESLARSFRSESDVYMDKDWRGMSHSLNGHAALPLSPTDTYNGYDAFEVRHPEAMRSESMNLQRAVMPTPTRQHSDPTTVTSNVADTPDSAIDTAQRRRWFSMKDKPKKGLNPDAKVFRLTKAPAADFGPIGSPIGAVPLSNGHGAHHAFDALNPNGLGSRMMSAASSGMTSSLLRAFAPSPAEREVLQRALGGSTNASLERLPSLSRVSSLTDSRPNSLQLERGVLPSWLQSLPRIGKSNFSPWDDEEPLEAGK
ncbi:hypothetical protein HWV62_43612 [Athelia sp. TMB]|nr:hypothetical protein HWV62_43612 [Athelia sp. TMB]